MKRKIILTLSDLWIGLILFIPVGAQNNNYAKLQPGDSFPNYTFDFVKYHTKSMVSTNEFKGKWLILSFWSSHCSVCLKKMPQEDSLQREFFKNVQFLLVGYTGSQYSYRKRSDYVEIQALYERARQSMNLSLPVAYDSTLFHKIDIYTCPYLIIIDPAGVVKAITNFISSNELKALLNGEKVVLGPAYRRWEIKQRKTTAL